MTTFLPRSAWTKHGPAKPMKKMAVGPVKGFALHWPGTTEKTISATAQSSIAGRLEGYREYHVDGHGWSDIAYQYAIDQAGRVWECRGLTWMSAANGNQAVNTSHGAVLLMLGNKEAPSAAMIQAVRDFRAKVWLKRFPKATAVIGHGNLFKTECPGPVVADLIKKKVFVTPPPPPKHGPLPPTPKPPAPRAARKPLMTDYVYGEGPRDSMTAVLVSILHPNVLPLFNAGQAQEAAAQSNRVLLLGGPAVKTFKLEDKCPVGSTTIVGNYTVANGTNADETVTRGLAAAKALQAG